MKAVGRGKELEAKDVLKQKEKNTVGNHQGEECLSSGTKKKKKIPREKKRGGGRVNEEGHPSKKKKARMHLF